MSLHVYLHIVLAGETLATQTTLVRVLSSVDLCVLPQHTGLREASTTMFTLEIVLPRVPAVRDYQLVSPYDTLITMGALVGSSSCVVSDVSLQLAAGKTLLSTDVTLDCLAGTLHHLPVVPIPAGESQCALQSVHTHNSLGPLGTVMLCTVLKLLAP